MEVDDLCHDFKVFVERFFISFCLSIVAMGDRNLCRFIGISSSIPQKGIKLACVASCICLYQSIIMMLKIIFETLPAFRRMLTVSS